MNTRLPAIGSTRRLKLALVTAGLGLSVALAGSINIMAAPGAPSSQVFLAQNVDYISTDAGYALDLGFPVLVPSWIPSPFGGSPAIDAGGGYYGLYWMNGGGDPTFLHITGQVGGGLPAGSPWDLNNELFINASVMGYDAIHDVTPGYDAVWWIMGGVLYKVESRNSGTDSLSLANSLIAFVPPAYTEPEPEPTLPPVEPTPEPVYEEPVTPVVEEPVVEEPVFEEPEVTDPGTTEPVATESPAVETPGESTIQEETVTEPQGEGTDTVVPEESVLPTNSTSDGTGQSSVSSDGTGGPTISVIGGDGTGGTIDVYVPLRPPVGVEIP